MSTWKYGEKAALARKLGISPQQLTNILHGRGGATPDLAKRIEEATAGRINRLDVLYPYESLNPLVPAWQKKINDKTA